MPIRLARLLVALSVALLVPLQGLAAVAGDLCMGVGQHDHSHDAGAGGSHDGHDDGQGVAHCAPCVACCAAAAICSSPVTFAADDRVHALIAASPPVFSGTPPETLDRPPLAR